MLRPAHRRGFRRAAGYAWQVGSTRLLITARWLPASERRAAVEWRWTNDPLGGADEDHARCIAASGPRILECCGHSFVLTTHECAPGTVLDDGRTPLSCWRLHLDCTELGCAWSSGAASLSWRSVPSVSYTHLRAHETRHDLVCRLLLEKKKKTKNESAVANSRPIGKQKEKEYSTYR